MNKVALSFELQVASPLPVLFSSISCMWILLGVIRMGTGWTMAVSYRMRDTLFIMTGDD